MLLQCRASVEDCGSTLKEHWLNDTCLRKVYNRSRDRLMLGQPRRRIWWVGPHPLYEVQCRQLLNECWPAPAMVVEGIHMEYIFELVSFVLPLIISWTFRILAHRKDQHT